MFLVILQGVTLVTPHSDHGGEEGAGPGGFCATCRVQFKSPGGLKQHMTKQHKKRLPPVSAEELEDMPVETDSSEEAEGDASPAPPRRAPLSSEQMLWYCYRFVVSQIGAPEGQVLPPA